LADVFYGGRLRLELSCIQVNTVYAGHKKGMQVQFNVMTA